MKIKIFLIHSVVFIVVVFQGSICKHLPSFAGPFKVAFRKFLANASEDFHTTTGDISLLLYHSRYKAGHDQYFWGSVSHNVPLDDTVQMHMFMSVWANNQWKKNAFVLKFEKACTNLVRNFGTMSTWLHGPEGSRCPIRKGYWEVKNGTYDFRFNDFKVFPYGRYLLHNVWVKRNKNLGLFSIEVDVLPRL